MRVRLAFAVGALVVLPILLAPQAWAQVPTAQPPNSWVRKEVPGWIYWVPTTKWQATYGDSGITISSPTGDLVVDYGFSSWPVPLTIPEVKDFMLTQLAKPSFIGAITVTSMKAGPMSGNPGNETQRFVWRGLRQHPLKGEQHVQGLMYFHVSSDGWGANGYEALNVMAPSGQWKARARTLDIIRGNFLRIPSG